MEVGLVGVAALGRHQGGAVTRGEAVGRVVETDQLGGALGGEADLGPEPGPQALAAPSGLGREPLDPRPAPGWPPSAPRRRRLPGRPPALPRAAGQARPPRSRTARPTTRQRAVAPGPARRRGPRGHRGRPPSRPAPERGAQHRVRDHRRQPYLQALEPAGPPPASSARGREAGDEALSLLLTAGVLDDEFPVAEVEDHRDGRVRDQLRTSTRSFARSLNPPCGPSPRPGVTGPRYPRRRTGTNWIGWSHIRYLTSRIRTAAPTRHPAMSAP